MVIFLRIRITFLSTGDVTEKVSILSLSDIDSNGDVSPDLPDLDDQGRGHSKFCQIYPMLCKKT